MTLTDNRGLLPFRWAYLVDFKDEPTLISKLVGALDVSPIIGLILEDFPSERYYSYPLAAMVRSFIYAKLKGLKTPTAISSYLIENKGDASHLGFKQLRTQGIVPSDRNFRHFKQRRLRGVPLKLVGQLADELKAEIKKAGVILEDEIVVEEPTRKPKSDTTKRKIKNDELRRIRKFIKKKIFPLVWTETKYNAVFKRGDFLDLLLHMGLTHCFAEGGSQTLNLTKAERVPDSDTLLYHLKKYTRTEIEDAYQQVFDIINAIAKKNGLFKRKVDVAIDYTDDLYYGDKNDDMVVAVQPKDGTSYGYRFASISIVEKGKRFTLLAIPIGAFTFKDQAIETLVSYALRWVKIRNLYADRGFNAVDVIQVLEKHGINYLMPMVKNQKVKRTIMHATPPVVFDYTLTKGRKSVKTNLVVVAGEDLQKLTFITNLHITPSKAQSLLDLYSRRWGVETSYRVKNQFKPKTCSKNYVIRLFYTLFAFAMLNLWTLVNALIGKAWGLSQSAMLALTVKVFLTVLMKKPPP